MKNDALYSESNSATYSPEDNKLRLYVGRVPRAEYEALRAEGWTSTPKQDCDFVAHWTPKRRDTAESYAGVILDEDQGPADRAADRAERFGGYLDKRLDEATGHANAYDSKPQAHGYQSEARANRAAASHDRQGTRATDAWSKAEYWQRRTAGVIANALHKSSPGVRMGRIKELEAELRKLEKSHAEAAERAQARYDAVLSVAEHAAGTREKVKPTDRHGFVWELSKIRTAAGLTDEEKSPPEHYRRAVLASALSSWRDSDANKAKAKEAEEGTRPAAEIAAEWLEGKTRPAEWNAEEGTEWSRHLKLRIAYELQMLEAQGGRAAMVEMEVGGFIGKHQIRKVNKSPATGRVVSVTLRLPGDRWGNSQAGHHDRAFNIERLPSDAYTPPTDEDRAALADKKKAEKAAAPKVDPCPLINPTDEDAQKLQDLWNAANPPDRWSSSKEPKTVLRMTQAQYSANSGGTYTRCQTVIICEEGTEHRRRYYSNITRHSVMKVRESSGRVIIITDKPQKPIPWKAIADARAKCPTCQSLAPRLPDIAALFAGKTWSKEAQEQDAQLFSDAKYVGWAYESSLSQFGFTEAGHAALEAYTEAQAKTQPEPFALSSY